MIRKSLRVTHICASTFRLFNERGQSPLAFLTRLGTLSVLESPLPVPIMEQPALFTRPNQGFLVRPVGRTFSTFLRELRMLPGLVLCKSPTGAVC